MLELRLLNLRKKKILTYMILNKKLMETLIMKISINWHKCMLHTSHQCMLRIQVNYCFIPSNAKLLISCLKLSAMSFNASKLLTKYTLSFVFVPVAIT